MNWVAIAGAVIFFLGVLASIALHEVGHMVPAKLFGVKVTQYMVGFGKTLWSKKKGDTEYGIKLVPLGGFVRMIGMFPPGKDGTVRKASTGPFQSLVEQARQAEHEDIGEEDKDRLFYQRKWWQKVIIMAGGPMMNVFLAIFLFGIVLVGFGTYVPQAVVADVPDCVIPVKEQRTECNGTDKASPAAAAGFKTGDKLVAFDGKPMAGWDDLSNAIRANGAGQATVTIERNGKRMDLHPTLMKTERPSKDNPTQYVEVGYLGIGPQMVKERQSPLAVFSAIGNYTSLTVQAMGRIPDKMVGVAKAAFGQEREADSPMSVIGASRVAGEIAGRSEEPISDRIAAFIQWLAALNLFVALFNFIPLLPLDGGHIAGALWEGIKRGVAKVRGRPDPGYVDVAKGLPIAYAMASVLIVMGLLLVYADIVNPVRLPG